MGNVSTSSVKAGSEGEKVVGIKKKFHESSQAERNELWAVADSLVSSLNSVRVMKKITLATKQSL